MLKYLNPYYWLGAAAIAVAAWGAWQWQGHSHYKAGQTAERSIWEERDRVALAVGNETTALLKRANAQNTGVLDAKLRGIEQTAAVRAMGLAHASRTIDKLRVALDERSAATPSGDPACPAARSDEIQLGRCESLLSGGLALASGAGRVVGQGQDVLERGNAALEAMEAWARLVLSVQEND